MKSAPHKPLLHFSFFFWWHQMNESSSSLISPLSLIHSLSLTSRQAWRMLGVAARGKNVDVFGVFFLFVCFSGNTASTCTCDERRYLEPRPRVCWVPTTTPPCCLCHGGLALILQPWFNLQQTKLKEMKGTLSPRHLLSFFFVLH